ncbi:PUA-like domain-containing protein [Irpex lacteus]|nr:PUA-like domain-containing protein [Irpex lacteus]
MPDKILPLLRCPLCPFSTLLEAPITLHCGHTVCSKHVIRPHTTSTSCPLPTCTSRNATAQQAQIHPESGVNFRSASPQDVPMPMPLNARADSSSGSGAPRVDVTVNKILSLTTRTHRELQRFQYDAPLAGLSAMGVSSSSSASNSTTTTHRPRRHSRSRSRSHTHSHDARDFASRHSRLPSAQERSTSRLLLSNRRAASALFEKELLSELTCEICFALMWQPVTTPCQHTFCSKCLLRSMDHSTACPLCRQELPGYVYAQDQPCNKVVLSIILKAFPAPYAERGSMIEAEERDTRLDTPIFVCQLSFPGMPTMLHLFEPRYRLMLRRCLASSNPCFGMIPPPRPTSSPASPGNDFGTMLRIKSVQMLPDGRSVVETWGTWRFRIMERGMLDGYVVARVERVEDQDESLYESDEANVEDIFSNAPRDPASGPESSAPGSSSHVSPASRSSVASQPIGLPTSFPTTTLLPFSSSNRVVRGRSNEELMNLCHEFLEQLKQGTPWVVQHLERTIVPMPTDPAQFSFWMALLLPIDEHEKAKLLPIRSPRLRLRLVVHWIEQLRSHWWFSGGCVIS